MNADKYIDSFIEKEKEIQSNPFLSTRILAKIETETAPQKNRYVVLKTLAVAASFMLIIFAGIGIGSTYESDNTGYTVLNVNDSQIENLNYYTFDSYE